MLTTTLLGRRGGVVLGSQPRDGGVKVQPRHAFDIPKRYLKDGGMAKETRAST